MVLCLKSPLPPAALSPQTVSRDSAGGRRRGASGGGSPGGRRKRRGLSPITQLPTPKCLQRAQGEGRERAAASRPPSLPPSLPPSAPKPLAATGGPCAAPPGGPGAAASPRSRGPRSQGNHGANCSLLIEDDIGIPGSGAVSNQC